ncbi:hypothetical protein C8Q75DRAFT_805377 [Abortiporus biennis]|nr:hypothetical protein C8Q75DRAFT_805377 [Abortiporus biennis]
MNSNNATKTTTTRASSVDKHSHSQGSPSPWFGDSPSPNSFTADETSMDEDTPNNSSSRGCSADRSSSSSPTQRNAVGPASRVRFSAYLPIDDEDKQMRRKEQNRAAQKAFRERKERHVKDLEERVTEFSVKFREIKHENELLRELLCRVQRENVVLRQSNARLLSRQTPRSEYSNILPSISPECFGLHQNPTSSSTATTTRDNNSLTTSSLTTNPYDYVNDFDIKQSCISSVADRLAQEFDSLAPISVPQNNQRFNTWDTEPSISGVATRPASDVIPPPSSAFSMPPTTPKNPQVLGTLRYSSTDRANYDFNFSH